MTQDEFYELKRIDEQLPYRFETTGVRVTGFTLKCSCGVEFSSYNVRGEVRNPEALVASYRASGVDKSRIEVQLFAWCSGSCKKLSERTITLDNRFVVVADTDTRGIAHWNKDPPVKPWFWQRLVTWFMGLCVC